MLYLLSGVGARDGLAQDIALYRSFPISSDGLSSHDPAPVIYPGDVNGDGQTDFIVNHGTFFLRVYDHAGNLLWEKTNASGMKNVDPYHPWDHGMAWDMDGDGKDEVLAFVQKGTDRVPFLTIFDGTTGAMRYEVKMWFTPSPTSHNVRGMIEIAYMHDRHSPEIVVNDEDTGREVRAYNSQLREIWRNYTYQYHAGHAGSNAGGGHYIWAYDVNGDGLDEILAGKYVLDKNGHLLYILEGWPKHDHVDGLVVADIDPTKPGVEIIAVGQTGCKLFRGIDGKLIWSLSPDAGINDVQSILVGEFDRHNPGLEIAGWEKTGHPAKAFMLSRTGAVLRRQAVSPERIMHFVMDFDGARSEDELIYWQGHVRDGRSRILQDTSWYRAVANDRINYGIRPFSIDLQGDPREELVAWSKTRLFIGKNRQPFQESLPSFRRDREYKLRYATSWFRAARYFDFRSSPVPADK